MAERVPEKKGFIRRTREVMESLNYGLGFIAVGASVLLYPLAPELAIGVAAFGALQFVEGKIWGGNKNQANIRAPAR